MSELELALIDLGRRVEFPATPDLGPAVTAALAERSHPRRLVDRRRALVLALVALVATVGALFAIPGTRAAILELFHLRGVTIERVGELPTVSVQHDFNKLLVGDEVTLAEARRRVDFEIAVPHGLGEPDGVYVQDSPPGGMVSFVWGTLEHPRALLTEFRGQVREVIYKAAGPGTKITPAYVGGEPGYYLSGAPHLFTYFDRTGEYRQEEVRLAGNVLVWERGPLTLRLEADVDKARALAIGRALR